MGLTHPRFEYAEYFTGLSTKGRQLGYRFFIDLTLLWIFPMRGWSSRNGLYITTDGFESVWLGGGVVWRRGGFKFNEG
jgi:hypothetical protein